MKKIYLMIAAFALLSMTANAQGMKRISKEVLKNVAQTQVAMKAAAATGAKVGSRAGSSLEDNQRYINYSCNENLVWPSSFPNRGTGISVGTIYFNDVFKKYEGCKIVGARFYLNRSIGNSKMTICKITEDGSVTDALLSKEVPSTAFGWNYVWFDDSYELKDGDFYGLLPYYDFFPANLPSDAGYPIGSSGTWVGQYGYLAYGDIEEESKDPSQWMWTPMVAGYTTAADGTTIEGSNLMLQLIIEKQDGTFILHDIVMDDVAMAPFSKLGGSQAFAFTCHNDGRDDITNATFGIDLDGQRLGTVDFKSYAYDSSSEFPNITDADYANVPVVLPIKDMAVGEHELSVYPVSVGGKAPEGDLTNDKVTTKFKVFEENYDRTMNLLEYYSNQNSMYSYFGNENLNATATKRNENKDLKVEKSDVAIVDIHGDTSDGETITSDQFAIDDAKKLATYTTSAPASVAVNRYFYKSDEVNVENELAINIAAETEYKDNVIEVLGTVIDQSANLYPSFSTVGIESAVDGNKLSIKVKGKLAKDYDKLIGDDARLTVYLTEDGLRGKQITGEGGINKPRYTFNNVLRKIVTGNLGDALQVHGNTYENDYEVELDDAWKASKMHIVAFVSRPMKEKEQDGKTALASELTDVWVDNTNMVEVGESDMTGISQAINWQDAKEVARYTIDGQKISAPVKGVNIVKLSNGKTIKVIVK